MTCPPDSNRMWEDRGTGSPFFSQFIWGGGVPVARHSILIEVSTNAVSFSASSLLPLMAGGTTLRRKQEREGGVCVLLVQIISQGARNDIILSNEMLQTPTAGPSYCTERALKWHSQKRVEFYTYRKHLG